MSGSTALLCLELLGRLECDPQECLKVCVCVFAHARACKGVLTPFVPVQECEQSLSVRLQHAMQVSWPGPLSRATG